MILENLEEVGQISRKAYQRRLPSDTSKDYYFMQRDTGNVQSLTVEYGFLDNINDAEKLKNNWAKYADAVVDAVAEYIGLSSETSTYTVKSGDSLWSIAKKFDITVEELKAANDLESNLLRVGQTLKIPSKETSPTGDYLVYTVKAGDSLYSIGKQYGFTVDELVKYNNLATTSLKVNQQLLIPKKEDTISPNTYTVVSGDTLYSIAKKFNTTINELMQLNNLSSSVLTLGQTLQIPTSDNTNSNDYLEYVVKSGDSLYIIAQKYNTTVNKLKELNDLNSNLLSIGQVLRIPRESSSITYTVKSGDSLYSIAQNYNTTVDDIKRKNGLSNNLLNIGQVLVI